MSRHSLRVPKYGALLQFLNFGILWMVFILCLSSQNVNRVSLWEGVFIILAAAFTLKEYTAATEHGWFSEIPMQSATYKLIGSHSIYCKCGVRLCQCTGCSLSIFLDLECIRLVLCSCIPCLSRSSNQRTPQ